MPSHQGMDKSAVGSWATFPEYVRWNASQGCLLLEVQSTSRVQVKTFEKQRMMTLGDW